VDAEKAFRCPIVVGVLGGAPPDWRLRAWRIHGSFLSSISGALLVILAMAKTPDSERYTEEETIMRREAMLKRMLSTPPKHRTAKGEKVNPPKKRGRPKKKSAPQQC
jgi:hypothetical protein